MISIRMHTVDEPWKKRWYITHQVFIFDDIMTHFKYSCSMGQTKPTWPGKSILL